MKTRKWSAYVNKTSDALDLPKGLFKQSAKKIAKGLKHSAEVSRRRKGTVRQSAMSMLNFYINRAGKNLTRKNRKKLQIAKKDLKKFFDKKGGGEIGRGEYGYVIEPGIPCKSPDMPSGYVTKIMDYDEDDMEYIDEKFERLKIIASKLKEIDEPQKYFLRPIFCDEFGDLSDENKTDGVKEENKKYSYNMIKGGTTLHVKYDHELKRLDNFIRKINSKNSKENEKDAFSLSDDIWRNILNPIAIALKKLHDEDIIHNDLNTANIIYMNNNTPRFIDFESSYIIDYEEEDENYPKIKKDEEINRFVNMIFRGWKDYYKGVIDNIVSKFNSV